MKLFDRDEDGNFDVKDYLLFTTLMGTVFNLVLNVFGILGLGVSFTSGDAPVLNCEIVRVEGSNKFKCQPPKKPELLP